MRNLIRYMYQRDEYESGEKMQVNIERLDSFGRGISFVNGKVCFIENAMPKEIVDIKITKEKKKYSEAIVLNYIKEDENRQYKCPHQNLCGGCDILHLPLELQRNFKREKIKNVLNLEDIELVQNNVDFYRNKTIFHIDHQKLGFYQKKSNTVIPIDECLLLDTHINSLIETLKEVVVDNECSEAMVRIGNKTNEVMISITGKISLENIERLQKKCDVLYINNQLKTKKSQIKSIIGDKEYLISKDSFFQINPFITEKLYDYIKELIKDNQGKNVLDLYCGAGTIGIYISDIVDQVIGIEISESSINDARKNKLLNKVENIDFYHGDVKKYTDMIKSSIDTIIIDPPRAGVSKEVIDKLLKMKTKNIIYVSCDLYTLKRDLDLLTTEYNIEQVKAFDMFFNTHHVECVALMSRKESE